ncbi:MAG TPA: class I SAM-dependent methyltransferase, partial [Isosphaeraceae bacterium]|nr:class I SAM-dependent methyltransferase [Isosphaeraceae bacterium]
RRAPAHDRLVPPAPGTQLVTAAICRSCGNDRLELVLSLGRTPLANALLTEAQLAQPEARYPLDLAFCTECSLVQITETVPPEQLFSHYLYFSSFSDTMLRHAKQIANRLVESRQLGSDSLVIELASNDGYLLQFYREAGIPVLGIEPAANVAEAARQRGIPTLTKFFGEAVASELRDAGTLADVVHANNVLAHVSDLNGFVSGIATVLKPGGVAVIEVPHVKTMLESLEFDTIYHEHLCYFSLISLQALFSRHDLRVVDVERLPIHGGSLQLFIESAGTPSDAVCKLLEEERAMGLDRLGFYEDFGSRVEALKDELRECLGGLRREGKRIAAYGASAKGSTLLNYCGIGRETLEFVVDRSTVKQGLYTPGTHLPILAPEEVQERRPDYLLLLVWNLADEIFEQQHAYRERGGRFIIPIPEVKVV